MNRIASGEYCDWVCIEIVKVPDISILLDQANTNNVTQEYIARNKCGFATLLSELYQITMGNIHRQLLEEKYLLKDGIKIISKRTAIPKVYEYMDLILQNDFKIKDEDKLDKDTYFFAAGENLNGYLNIAKYFIDDFLR